LRQFKAEEIIGKRDSLLNKKLTPLFSPELPRDQQARVMSDLNVKLESFADLILKKHEHGQKIEKIIERNKDRVETEESKSESSIQFLVDEHSSSDVHPSDRLK